jgi:ribosomal-protein-alanine N-acetyltransferase
MLAVTGAWSLVLGVSPLDGNASQRHMKAPIKLETTRLVLRQPLMSDAAKIFERYASNAEVTRFLGWPRHRSVRDTEAFLRFSAQEWDQWPAGPYLIISRNDGQLLGSTGFGFQTPHEAMTGYVLARDAWGKGFATEALTAIVDVAAQIGVTRLFALCHPEHRPSRRVLEKCGFVRDDMSKPAVEFPNLSPGVRQEALCYALVFAGTDNA